MTRSRAECPTGVVKQFCKDGGCHYDDDESVHFTGNHSDDQIDEGA